ncbi:hypothetical protein HWV62_17008 [Athelia sp. TMB]|nr:hypothetical protein HWV62_17008 [Athelia sp. TMB]
MEAKKILNETCVAPFKKYEKQGIPHMAHLRGDEFQALILELVGDISDTRPGDANKALVAGMGAAIGFIGSGPAAPVLIPAAVVLVLAKWGYDVYQQIPDIIMRLMAYVVNLILVMQLLFLALADRRCELTSSLIKTVVALYRDSHVKSEIHAKIKTYANGGLFSRGRDQTFENVSSLIKEYYDSEGIRELKDKILAVHGSQTPLNTTELATSA